MQSIQGLCKAVIYFMIIASLTACGGGIAPPELGQVTGKVTLDGVPLTDASVTFMPEKVRASSCMTDSEGKFDLVYIRDEKGAAIGHHKVIVSKLKNETEVIPEEYNSETELTADVKSGTNEINFDLTSK
ncbi:hypothetical protein [Gimesia sp.]|uniref:hypothetical protein n=1 Tax=Gimesia sp. TaxID=2024833 RepID=UPI003A9077C8